jgi:hypothetical protein
MIERVREHVRVFRQQSVDRAPQISDSLAVNDPDLKDSAFPARRKIIRHETLHFAGIERVQIQHTIDGNLNRVVHAFANYSGRRKGKELIPAAGFLALGSEIKQPCAIQFNQCTRPFPD